MTSRSRDSDEHIPRRSYKATLRDMGTSVPPDETLEMNSKEPPVS
jgi:hypothetical protein